MNAFHHMVNHGVPSLHYTCNYLGTVIVTFREKVEAQQEMNEYLLKLFDAGHKAGKQLSWVLKK